jgi:hypothetical protein
MKKSIYRPNVIEVRKKAEYNYDYELRKSHNLETSAVQRPPIPQPPVKAASQPENERHPQRPIANCHLLSPLSSAGSHA